ncbi:ectoine/hydroxyectoine ABC transporter substrate-binding protein EhuB [Nonomuraea sp. K274]|uniref:Ectoine/hydroxyectoine ABC transporter substrate-binding protein EhuB n=1 Tax=Nonomuraea cypriaca TaxID=1187855 RepID=A0A931A654_9ACTN|nr:ectoine/hydroxyectoine ABC transporter substrate-binding protein EhuB [Nonomuraea cypriaca]MBF8184758.1 ectoine/hydroxyectoine ABC transporter substrate-binding protein EhuB [Nonomuraea cypriaca]
MTNDPSRRALLRGLGAAAVAAPLTAWLAGCSRTEIPGSTSASQDLLATGRKQGYLRVGIANEPPYTQVTADGNVTGAEPDVFRAVCKRLGINDVQGIITPYASMIPGLKANRWDAIAAGLFMKQSRCAEVLYSEPVIVSTESFGVKPGNPKRIVAVADVLANAELKIAVLPGGFEDGILKTAKVPDGQLVKVDDGRSGIEALRSGRADAFFLPTLSLQALREKDKDFEVTAPVDDAPVTGSGAAFRPTDKTFLAAYNKELAAFKETPEFADILKKWGFDAAATKGVTSAELCKNDG